MLMSETGSGGGGQCSQRLSWVFGDSNFMSWTRGGGGPLQGYGEVAAGYERVFLICADGTQTDATVLDCVEHIGFNVYVTEVLTVPLRAVATNGSGQAFSKLTFQPSFWAHETPEAAALAGWPEDSQVRVASVEVQGDRAEVVLETDPEWPNRVYCVRTRDRWHEAISTNGPTTQWDDPWPDPMSPPPERLLHRDP
jgi:hypothetical protein